MCACLQACKIVLQLPGSSEGEKGYNELCLAIVILMSCGMDYARQQAEDLRGRVLVSVCVCVCVCLHVFVSVCVHVCSCVTKSALSTVRACVCRLPMPSTSVSLSL